MQRHSGVVAFGYEEETEVVGVDFDEEEEEEEEEEEIKVYSVQVKSQEPVFVAPSAVKRTLSSACLRLCVFGKWNT